MKLDLTQNILLLLAVFTSIISITLLFHIIRQNKVVRKMSKTLTRLKYEVTKIQEGNNSIVKTISNEDTRKSWVEEDELRKKEQRKKKALKKEKKRQKYLNFRSKFPDDIEYYLSEKVWDKIGIAAFLVGLALFINVSMDMEWINKFGRLFFGIILTLVFLIVGYLMRKKYFHFSNILLGGGIASLIFTMFAAYYQYHIIHLALWIVITIFVLTSTILISISVKRHEIVLITFIAAYIAPFTVKFSANEYFVLFSYLTILNIGIIIYDYYQKSILVNFISFGFTFIIYTTWLVTKIYLYNEVIPYWGAFLFLTLFYILFFFMVLVNNIREGREFHKMDFSIFMTAKGVYFGAGAFLIKTSGVDYLGLFAGLIGIINYSFFLALYKRKNFDRRILNIFLAMSIMFFSLIIPIEFYGKTVTMIWSFQTVLLMFLIIRTKHQGMRTSVLMLSVGMVISLCYDLYNQYISTTGSLEYVRPIFNQNFLTSLFVISSLVSIIIMLTKVDTESGYFIKNFLKTNLYRIILIVILVFTVYFSFLLELRYTVMQKYDNLDVVNTFTSVYNLGFLSLTALVALFVRKKPMGIVAACLAVVTTIIYIAFYSKLYISIRSEFLLGAKISSWQFNVHYIGALLIFLAIISALSSIKIIFPKKTLFSYVVTYVLVFCLIFMVSSETTQFFTTQMYKPHILIQNIVRDLYRFEYSVAWGLTAFIIITLGIFLKEKQLRVVGVTLYFVTLFKVIFYDFWTDTNQELIISFTFLGIILLLISFLFQYFNKKVNPQSSALN